MVQPLRACLVQRGEHQHVGNSERAAHEVQAIPVADMPLGHVEHLLQLGRVRVRLHVVHPVCGVMCEA